MNIFKLFKGAKFDYDQIKEENVVRNLNFQVFVSDHLKLKFTRKGANNSYKLLYFPQ